jgi:ParB-like chromosome segregation protein Spo0J
MSELKFHPLADIFPLMEGKDFDDLVADIKANGLREPIRLYENQIIDGRNRYRALQRLGDPKHSRYLPKNFRYLNLDCNSDDGARAYVISANIHRRHLSAEQKRDLLVELVKASPEKSDRQLAKEAGTTHPTIAKARKQAEATGKAFPVEKRVGGDGRVRKQPQPRPRLSEAVCDLMLGPDPEADGKASKQPTKKAAAKKKAKKQTRYGPPLDVPPPVAEQISRFVRKLIDIGIAQELYDILDWDAAPIHLFHALTVELKIEDGAGNAPPPDTAEVRKAQMAALDDGADPGEMPDILRRLS